MKKRELFYRMKHLLEKYAYHFFFLISIILLIMLSIWWSVFINQSVENLRTAKYENLEKTLDYYALEICSSNVPPVYGEFAKDKRFEIKNKECKNKLQTLLCKKWGGLVMALKDNVLSEIEKDYKSKKTMVIGETIVFIFVVLISVMFLYLSIKNEKKTTMEIKNFFERITHEIKTPITGIKALLQSIKSGTINKKDLILYTELALGQINKQEKLTENMLAGSYLKSKRGKIELEIIEIKKYIERYFENYSYLNSDIELSIKTINDKEYKVLGNTYFLKVILDNLVDNAIKYCTSKLKLDVILKDSDDDITLIVSDNGPGIDKETAEIIFEAYRSTKSGMTRKNQGSGIGLNISKNMAKKMGSDLKYRNRDDQSGSEFYFNLKKV